MQMQLPIFPVTTRLINTTVGVFLKDEFVYYLHNGSPIHCHSQDDMNSYRYITANLVNTGLCNPGEIAKALGVNSRNIQRYSKALREKGAAWFFNREEKRGQCNKMTDSLIGDAQELIDKFYSISDIGRLLGVTEGAIRYHIRKGTLKKKP
jgi:predicted transcriptional regulator